MWAEYCEFGFPIVQVRAKGTIKNDEDFYNFASGWLKYYERKQDFVIVFDAIDVGFINIKYAFKLANFIKELKKQEIHYLKHIIVVTENWCLKFILKMIFGLQSPCSVDYHSDFDDLDLENLIMKTKGTPSLELQ